MPDEPTLVNHVQEWMRPRGWSQVCEGPAGSMWVNRATGTKNRVGVLRNLTPGSFHFRDLVERLSEVHQLPSMEIITDSIPLTARAAMLDPCRACAPDELLRANVGDLCCTDDGAVIHVRGKGGKDRRIPIEPALVQVLERYLDTRATRFPAAAKRRPSPAGTVRLAGGSSACHSDKVGAGRRRA